MFNLFVLHQLTMKGGEIMKKIYVALLFALVIFLITGCPLTNKNPVWTNLPNLVKHIGEVININLSAYCTDPEGETLTYSIVSGPGSIVGNNYTWTVAAPLGVRTVEIKALDSRGGEANESFIITVKSPPNVPSDPSPQNNAINQNYSLTLSWTGGDPDGDTVVYDIYLSTNPNPGLFISNRTTTSYSIGSLQSYTKYYWRIVAKDGENTVSGPIWNFTTKPFVLVNDNFETRPSGNLSASTLPWATYTNGGTSYGTIQSFGFNASKGLTFYDSTIDGYAMVRRTSLTPAKVGIIEFYFRITANGFFGVGDRTNWAPYVLVGNYGSGYGLYIYDYEAAIYKKLTSLNSYTWYKVTIEFNLTSTYKKFSVYVNDSYKGYESYSTSFSLTQFELIVFSDTICNYVDIDNVYIAIYESGYTTSEMHIENYLEETDSISPSN